MSNLHSASAESNVLSALMLQPSLSERISTILRPESFYAPVNGETFRLILAGHNSPPRLAVAMAGHPAFPTPADCQTYLAGLFSEWHDEPEEVVLSSARYVAELHAQRTMVGLTGMLTTALENREAAKAEAIKAQIEKLSLAVIEPKKQQTPADQLREALEYAAKPGVVLKTGVRQWDSAFGGFSKGARYVIAAYPGAGKTALAVNLSWGAAVRGAKVRYLSLEEDKSLVRLRMVAHPLKISMNHLKPGEPIPANVLEHIHAHTDELTKPDLLVLTDLHSTGQMIDACGQCDLIVVDGSSFYPAPSEYTKVDKAGYVADECIKLSRHTGAAVLLLSHINSEAVRTGPTLAGIYGGQAAAFDPTGIIEIRRANSESGGDYQDIQAMVLKNRYGEVGRKMHFSFHGQTMTFYDKVGQ